jgi:hypothetical protein
VPLRRAAANNATEPATMVRSFKKNSKETKNSNDTTMFDDNVTVGAETPTTKINFIEAEVMDIMLRYEVPYRNGKSDPDNFKQRVQLLSSMTKAFDKSNLRIYDNQNQPVKSCEASKWLNKEYYDDHFTIHEARLSSSTK